MSRNCHSQGTKQCELLPETPFPCGFRHFHHSRLPYPGGAESTRLANTGRSQDTSWTGFALSVQISPFPRSRLRYPGGAGITTRNEASSATGRPQRRVIGPDDPCGRPAPAFPSTVVPRTPLEVLPGHLEGCRRPTVRRLDAPGPACPYTVVTMTGIEVPLDSSRDMRQQSGLHYCLVSSCLHGHGKPTYAHCSCWPVRTGFPGCRGMTLGGFLRRQCVKGLAKAPALVLHRHACRVTVGRTGLPRAHTVWCPRRCSGDEVASDGMTHRAFMCTYFYKGLAPLPGIPRFLPGIPGASLFLPVYSRDIPGMPPPPVGSARKKSKNIRGYEICKFEITKPVFSR